MKQGVHGAVQGSQLAGGSEEGVRVEGAPLTLLEGVTDFLIHQRAALRKEAIALPHGKPESAAAESGVSCAAAFVFRHWGSMLATGLQATLLLKLQCQITLTVHHTLRCHVARVTFIGSESVLVDDREWWAGRATLN